MATKGKAPASRSLNYSLSGDILNRVSRSLDTGSKEKAIEEGISGITDAAGDFVQGLVDNKVAQRKKGEDANATYEAGMDAFGTRASWSTPETYDKFMDIEKQQRNEYVDAISSGDQAKADKILRTQKERAIQQQAWKTSFESLGKLKDDDHMLSTENMGPEASYIIGRMTSQEGEDFKIEYNDKGEMVMTFNSQDDPSKKITMRGRDFDKLVAQNSKPIKQKEAILALTKTLEEDKVSLKPFNFASTFSKNQDIITPNNINSMMKGSLGLSETGSFLESFDSHPDWNRISKTDLTLEHEGTTLKNADANNDGVISGDEFLKFSKNDKDAIKELLQKPENFKIAQAYLAEFITLNVSRDLKGFNPRIGNSNKRYDDLINEIENE